MRRLQVYEAMNYAEKHGFSYILTYSPTAQFRMRFPIDTGTAIAKHLRVLDMEIADMVTDAIEHGWVELR